MRRCFLYVILGYLSGSVLYARLFSRSIGKEEELLQSPDHNPGTSNAFACGGFTCGVLTLLGDILKGLLPVALFTRGGVPVTAVSLALVLAAPVVGHAFPCLYGFRGGKGIATSFGCLLGLAPMWAPVSLLAGCFIFFSTIICITPHFQRTAVTYFVTLILMAVTHQPNGVICGFILIVITVSLRLHLSTEQREPAQVHIAGRGSK